MASLSLGPQGGGPGEPAEDAASEASSQEALPEGMQRSMSVVGDAAPAIEVGEESEHMPAPEAEEALESIEEDEVGPPEPAAEVPDAEPAEPAPTEPAPTEPAAAEPKSAGWSAIKSHQNQSNQLKRGAEALSGQKVNTKRLYGADLVRYLRERAGSGVDKKEEKQSKWKFEGGRWVINDQAPRNAIEGDVTTSLPQGTKEIVNLTPAEAATAERCKKCEQTIPVGGKFNTDKEGSKFHLDCLSCAGCLDSMEGEVYLVENKYYHADCFACCVCSAALKLTDFYVGGGKPYCKAHASVKEGETCAKCGDVLQGRFVWGADGQKFHKDCFTCTQCGCGLERYYVSEDNLPYCFNDFLKIYGQDCVKCGKKINGQMRGVHGIEAAKDCKWHVGCFNCAGCSTALSDEVFYYDKTIWCKGCLQNSLAVKCTACDKGILGRCISALDGKWHPECFVCTHCKEPLNGFVAKDGLPYCKKDFLELFASKCAACSRPIEKNFVNAGGTKYHPECFACVQCGKKIAGGFVSTADKKPLCGHECAAAYKAAAA